MPLKTQYLNDIGLTTTRPFPGNPCPRTRKYFMAARVAITNQQALTVWTNHLQQIYNNIGVLPATQTAYDTHITNQMILLERTINLFRGNPAFGVAQKVINLFMKDLWAFNMVPPPLELLLHFPLDRTILSRIRNIPATWQIWTYANTTAPTTINDYLQIQQTLRTMLTYHRHINNPIELDQFLWHTY